jgi:hypothetical protein
MWKDWMITSPASTAELVERMRRFTKPTIAFVGDGRDLHFSKDDHREGTEQGFHFVVSADRAWFQCSGVYSPAADGTQIRIQLRPHRDFLLLFGLVSIPFGVVSLWGFWPINHVHAIGITVALESFVVALFWLYAWRGARLIRRELMTVLSAPAGKPTT